jgi:hypothetical protein
MSSQGRMITGAELHASPFLSLDKNGEAVVEFARNART